MRWFDRACGGALLLLAIVECWLVPRNYPGRIWIFGTGLALLFTAMLNLLRVGHGRLVPSLQLFSLSANVMMFTFAIALIASVGWPRTRANPQVLLMLGLLAIESAFSLLRKP